MIVKQSVLYLAKIIDHFTLRDLASAMKVEDRLPYLSILSHLSVAAILYTDPVGNPTRANALGVLKGQLEEIQTLLRSFDAALAKNFFRDYRSIRSRRPTFE